MLKKTLALFVILCCFLKVNAQIPEIKSNVLDEQKSKSLIYKIFSDKYDLLISYQTVSWTSGDIQILALKNKRWKKITLSFLNGEPVMTAIKKQSFPRLKANQLMAELTLHNFWTLSNDSINMKEITPKNLIQNHRNKDTVVIVAYKQVKSITVMDGISYHFEILQENNLRIYDCNNPDTYFKYYPKIKPREHFINAKNAFEAAIKN